MITLRNLKDWLYRIYDWFMSLIDLLTGSILITLFFIILLSIIFIIIYPFTNF